MKITVIGGGPGGLYFALLTKKARPDFDIEVIEQNREGDTFGFGVVFSDETLDEFFAADPESYDLIRDHFAYWQDMARTLERGCDPLLDGHCLHLRERAEAIALILETATDPAS